MKLNNTWDEQLKEMYASDYFRKLVATVSGLYNSGTVYPPRGLAFNALLQTPFDKVKAVILGQDPYHEQGQAHGLSFSVPKGVQLPPSLVNIYKELLHDIKGVPYLEAERYIATMSGDLTAWAQQGVLLLNSSLTVGAGQANSHSNVNWYPFTDEVISCLSKGREHIAFILWGSYAKSKIPLIDCGRHLILTSAHPSPLSVYRGFYGSSPFSKTNAYLAANGIQPISWLE